MSINQIALQRRPDIILWCVLSDGTLLSCTYERDQDVVAWASHDIGGTDVVVDSVCVIPGTSEDEVWIEVARTVDSSTVRYVEQLQPRDFGDQEDAWFVDSGISYDSDATNTFDGLDHLEGETVQVLGDGQVLTDCTVSSGEITLATADGMVSRAIIGLSYRYTLQPMRLDVMLVDGTTLGSIKRIAELVVSFYETLNAQFGTSTSDLYDFDWRVLSGLTDDPVLFTGEKVVAHDGGYDDDDTFVISGDDPVPCTVRAIVPRIEKVGR